MSDKRDTRAIDAVEAVSPRTNIWRDIQIQLTVRDDNIYERAVKTLNVAEEHFLTVATQLREQPLLGHDFEHTDSFFHRFMRAAADDQHATDLHHILTKDASVRPHQTTLSPSLQEKLNQQRLFGTPRAQDRLQWPLQSTQRAGSVEREIVSGLAAAKHPVSAKPSFAKKIALQNAALTPRLGVRQKKLQDGDFWDQEPRYKLSRIRRRQRLWGEKFTLTRPYGREPFYFDHATTFYPLELKPPPDVDFIPFELYAALGVMVGWQWMVDEFVRKDFVADRTNASTLEVFLANYRLLGVAPAVALQGAIAHYPSEEQMLRILQYLSARSRAKARMRIELLDHDGKTVAEVWADYGILRRMAHSAEPVSPPKSSG